MKYYITYPTEEQAKIMIAFLDMLKVPYYEMAQETLPTPVLSNIAKGQADVAAGRTISLDEFKARLSSAK